MWFSLPSWEQHSQMKCPQIKFTPCSQKFLAGTLACHHWLACEASNSFQHIHIIVIKVISIYDTLEKDSDFKNTQNGSQKLSVEKVNN